MHKQAAEQRKLKKEKKDKEREKINKMKNENPKDYLKYLHEKRNVNIIIFLTFSIIKKGYKR